MTRDRLHRLACAAPLAFALSAAGCQAILGIKDPVVGAAGPDSAVVDGSVPGGGDGSVWPDARAGNQDGSAGNLDGGSVAYGTPMARLGHAMAYDAAAGKVVLFGGEDASNNVFDDTWEWDGTGWTDVTPATGSPKARYGDAMAYDAAAGKVVLFGGKDRNGTFLADTWEWDGTGWTDATPATGSPPARSYSAMVYDAADGKVVLFGGQASSGDLGDTWEWDGSSWAERPSATGREGAGIAYDAAHEVVVLFGGSSDALASFLNDTWEWDGSSWTNVTPGTGNPPARDGRMMAYDAARGAVVMFGGFGTTGDFDGTWAWDGSQWANATPTTGSPPARDCGAMAYDAARRQVVLFGGRSIDSGDLRDTWAWDGTSWGHK